MKTDQILEALRKRRPADSHPILDRAFLNAGVDDDNERRAVLLKATRKGLTKPRAPESIKQMYEDYEKTKALVKFADVGLKIGAEIANDGLSNLTTFRGGVRGALLATAAKAAMKVAINEAKDQLIGTWQTNNERLLATSVARYYDKHDSSFDALYALYDEGKDAQRVLRALGVQEIFESTEVMKGADAEGRNAMMLPVLERLTKVVAERSLEGIKKDALQDAELKRIAEENLTLWRDLHDHEEATGRRFDEVDAQLEDITKRLETTEKLATENQADINTLALIVSDSMPPAQRKALIEGGLIEMSPEKRKEVLAELDSQIETQKRVANISHALDEGSAFVQVLKDLKVDPSVVEPIRTIVGAGQAAFNAYTQFQSMNYFGAAASVTGFLGGGSSGPDPEVMKMLNLINKKLDDVLRKIDQVLANQKKMLAKLDALAIALDQGIGNLRADTWLNRTLIIQAEVERLEWFESLAASDMAVRSDFRLNRFPSYAELEALRQRFDLADRNKWVLFDTFIPGALEQEAPSPIFFLETHVGGLRTIEELKEEITGADKQAKLFSNLLTLTEGLCAYLGANFERVLGSMLTPANHVRHTTAKWLEVKDPSTNVGSAAEIYKRPLKELISRLLHVAFLGRTCEALLNSYLIEMMLRDVDDGELKLRPPDQMLSGPHSKRGLEWLNGTIRTVDLAIIQQTLLSGDVLLPMLYELFDGTLAMPKPVSENPSPKTKPGTPVNTDINQPSPASPEQVRLAEKIRLQELAIQTLECSLDAKSSAPQLSVNVALYFVRERLQRTRGAEAMKVIHRNYEDARNDGSPRLDGLHQLLGTTGPDLTYGNRPIWALRRANDTAIWDITEKVKLPLPPMERISDDSLVQCYHTRAQGYLIELRKHLVEHRDAFSFAERVTQLNPDQDVYVGLLCSSELED